MDKIQQLTRLNVEIEGLLHVLSTRDSDGLREMLSDKFNQFSALFTELLADGQLENQAADVEEAVLKEAAEVLTGDVVKNEEAESTEVEDEMDASVNAVEREECASGICQTVQGDTALPNDEIIPVELGDFPEPTEDIGHRTAADTPETVSEIAATGGDAEFGTAEVAAPINDCQDGRPADGHVPANETQTVSDRLAEEMTPEIRVDEMIARKTAGDLSKAFTLNDKLRFRKTLFASNPDSFADALEKLSGCDTYSEAIGFLTSMYGWDLNDNDVAEFLTIIRPHYPKED